LAFYFDTPATPGNYSATPTYNYVNATTATYGSQSIILTRTVLSDPTPSGSASFAFLPAMTTFAGTGTAGYSGNIGPATDAELTDPSDAAVGHSTVQMTMRYAHLMPGANVVANSVVDAFYERAKQLESGIETDSSSSSDFCTGT
jgi:hypothetical protein